MTSNICRCGHEQVKKMKCLECQQEARGTDTSAIIHDKHCSQSHPSDHEELVKKFKMYAVFKNRREEYSFTEYGLESCVIAAIEHFKGTGSPKITASEYGERVLTDSAVSFPTSSDAPRGESLTIKSSCCKFPVNPRIGADGSGFLTCSNCGMGCSPVYETPPSPRLARIEPLEWRKIGEAGKIIADRVPCSTPEIQEKLNEVITWINARSK